jgi:hypothetical protein
VSECIGTGHVFRPCNHERDGSRSCHPRVGICDIHIVRAFSSLLVANVTPNRSIGQINAAPVGSGSLIRDVSLLGTLD